MIKYLPSYFNHYFNNFVTTSHILRDNPNDHSVYILAEERQDIVLMELAGCYNLGMSSDINERVDSVNQLIEPWRIANPRNQPAMIREWSLVVPHTMPSMEPPVAVKIA